jgi:uncharacterized BrkB/YihY/UPF0761 family membrane protein
MDMVWSQLLIKFQQGWTWLVFFITDNPVYGGLGLLFIIFLLWLILRPEINHR